MDYQNDLRPVAEKLIGIMIEKNLAPEKISAITSENVATAIECEKEVAEIIHCVFSATIKADDTWNKNLGNRLAEALKTAVEPPSAPKPIINTAGILGNSTIEKSSKLNDPIFENYDELDFDSTVRALLIRECMKLGINCHPKTLESKVKKAGFAFEKRSRDKTSIENWVRLEADRLDTRSQVIEILTSRGYTVIQHNSDQTPTAGLTVSNNDFIAILKSVENTNSSDQEKTIHQILNLYGFVKIIEEKKNILS